MAIKSRKLLNRHDRIELDKFERVLRVIAHLKANGMPDNTLKEKGIICANAYRIVYGKDN
jgi:hypothetical protein